MITIEIRVKPRSRISALEKAPDDTWIARLRAPPVEGKANAELVQLLSREFRCPKKSIVVKCGRSSRLKLVQIQD
jgi:uncharacterized protein (TIGR00251 family)